MVRSAVKSATKSATRLAVGGRWSGSSAYYLGRKLTIRGLAVLLNGKPITFGD